MKNKNSDQPWKLTIRPYREEDEEQVLSLVRELEAELAEKFPHVQIESGVNTYRTRYLKKGNKYVIYVAEVNNKIVGFLMGYPSLGIPEVDSLYDVLPLGEDKVPEEFYLQMTFVSRPYRNRGISTALHREIIKYALEHGYREVYACIAKWNFPELRVIRSLKFESQDLGTRYRLSLKLDKRKSRQKKR
jgi:GNAT superfamily N-acetyltransferase